MTSPRASGTWTSPVWRQPDGKPVSCEVAVEGTKLSNAIRFKGNDLYLTDTFFDLPDKRDQSGVWRFSLNEIGAGKPTLKVLPLAGLIDLAAERARLEKERAKAEDEAEKVRKKLGNADFVSRAKPEVVEENRERLAAAEAEISRLAAAVLRLQG